jgi:hypothetical protein
MNLVTPYVGTLEFTVQSADDPHDDAAGLVQDRIRITYAYQNHRWIFQRLEFWLDQWIDVTDKKGILTPLVEAASQASDGAERARNTGSYKETGDLRTHRLRTKGA